MNRSSALCLLLPPEHLLPPPNCRVLRDMATLTSENQCSQGIVVPGIPKTPRTSQYPSRNSSNQICTSESLTQGPLQSMSSFGCRISHWAHNLYFCCVSAGFNHSTVVQNGALMVPEEQVEGSMWKHLQKNCLFQLVWPAFCISPSYFLKTV